MIDTRLPNREPLVEILVIKTLGIARRLASNRADSKALFSIGLRALPPFLLLTALLYRST
jgi:hypothetical protein